MPKHTHGLGKLPPKKDTRTLQFSKYVLPKLVAPPKAVDHASVVHVWPMMLNDTYGDCTIAAAGHMIQDWTAYANTMRYPTDTQILEAYWKVSGGVGVDNGAYLLDVLNLWRNQGIGGDKIAAYVQLRNGNTDDVKNGVYLFGNVDIGISLPDYVVNGVDLLDAPWELPSQGPTPPPNPSNGHAICIVGYDATHVYTVTWGSLKKMSWGFYLAYADEAYAVLSNDWFTVAGISPEGFDYATLQQDLSNITTNQPPPPPEPPQPPVPNPHTGCLVWIPIVGLAVYGLIKLI